MYFCRTGVCTCRGFHAVPDGPAHVSIRPTKHYGLLDSHQPTPSHPPTPSSPPPNPPPPQGAEAFSCEVCKAKTPATKHLRLQRLPQILVLHIKRFKYRGFFTDKLTASVSYPLAGLSLDTYLSPEALVAGEGGALYDLYAVSNHYGNLSGGHYTAMCRVQSPQAPEGEWYCFNDDLVNRVSEDQVC